MRLTALIGPLTAFTTFTTACVVNLGSSQIVGTEIPTLKQEFFGGIPYAEPPVGSLRLRAPVLKTTYANNTVDARSYGKGCVQPSNDPASYSEDCLFLNVLRPARTPTRTPTPLLPVFLWIYGGGFLSGDSVLYNGSAIVAQSVARGTPVIYVSINYRTGPLGFPQGIEAAANGSLNLGLRDQVTALQWVQANIAYFGGDRKKVTVFGESAGAISIAIHQLRPNFSSLTRGVILESGSGATTVTNYAPYREKAFANFVASLPGCASFAGKPGALDCLRSQKNLTSAELIQAIVSGVSQSSEQYPYVPVLGDDIYPALPSVVLKAGNYSKIPFIAGTNLDEGTAFAGNPATITNETAKQSLLFSYSPSLLNSVGPEALVNAANGILDLYPDSPALGAPFNTGNETFGFDKAFKRVAAILGDLSFQSQRRLLQQEAAADGVTSYGYLFTDPQPDTPAYLGVTHGREVSYVFGACQTKTASAQALCQRMIDYWVSFAVSQTPNDGKGVPKPAWKKYTSANQVLLELNGANTSMIPDTYRKAQIDFINQNSVLFHHRRSL